MSDCDNGFRRAQAIYDSAEDPRAYAKRVCVRCDGAATEDDFDFASQCHYCEECREEIAAEKAEDKC